MHAELQINQVKRKIFLSSFNGVVYAVEHCIQEQKIIRWISYHKSSVQIERPKNWIPVTLNPLLHDSAFYAIQILCF